MNSLRFEVWVSYDDGVEIRVDGSVVICVTDLDLLVFCAWVEIEGFERSV